MRTMDMDMPTIIVELGQQRKRLKLTKVYFALDDLLELFSQAFQMEFNLKQHVIFHFDKRLDSMTSIDFSQLNNYQRFKIQSITNQNEITSLKQRLNTVSLEINEISFLINSIYENYQILTKTLANEKHQINHSNKSLNNLSNSLVNENLIHKNATVPPGFKTLSNYQQINRDSFDSQSTDEGIDHDVGSLSLFESARSDYDFESIYLECHDDNQTVVNQSNQMTVKNNSKLEWRNPSNNNRPRSHWNRNKIKYQTYNDQEQFGQKPRLKKSINPNKAPLPPEKKKNIPCKYAAGGNCKRGSQCRFIHVV